ncbi:lipase [Sphingomonas oleivorans]|uniref:Lipase n=1 Tax=Sphingomonas oleivorans TaxID=1735121 RepID=A0A2T5FVZ3_9SPHN|nr:alpha/beta hydrolase [Sphingomonas oleivorans]PTQ09947.1 lipase [Sphingomonas oleivorans]
MTEPFVRTPYIRPDVKVFVDYLNAVSSPGTHELGAIEARRMMAAMRPLIDLPTGKLALIRNLAAPGPDGRPIPLRLYDSRAARAPGPVLVFFHGGGWVLGDLDTHEPLCAEIARMLDIPVIAVDYRLAPEHRWPAAPDDCEAAARWIAAAPAELERAVTGLVLAGDSAGGTLTIVTALALRDVPAAVPVLAQWPIYPAVDAARKFASFDLFGQGYVLSRETMDWYHENYAADLDHWRGAPIRGDQGGMPPTLVLTASLDPLRDHGRTYAAATIAAGVPTIFREAAGTVHGFLNLRRAIPSSQQDLAGALATLKAMIAEAETTRPAPAGA